MEKEFFIANKKQMRSALVLFSTFIIEEMAKEKVITSQSELIMLAELYDKLIEKFINEKFIKGGDKK